RPTCWPSTTRTTCRASSRTWTPPRGARSWRKPNDRRVRPRRAVAGGSAGRTAAARRLRRAEAGRGAPCGTGAPGGGAPGAALRACLRCLAVAVRAHRPLGRARRQELALDEAADLQAVGCLGQPRGLDAAVSLGHGARRRADRPRRAAPARADDAGDARRAGFRRARVLRLPAGLLEPVR